MNTPIGDIKGFFFEMIRNICFILGIGYMGGSFTALCKADEAIINTLFPTDIDAMPYQSTDKTMATLKKDGPMEYLFPMKHLGFPYSKISPGGVALNDIKNWFIFTCVYAFVTLRSCYKSCLDFFGYFIKDGKSTFSEWIIFYGVPYLWIYGTKYLTTFIAIVGIAHGALINQGWIFAFSPILLWMYKFTRLKEITLGSLFSVILFQIPGFFLPMLFIPYWMAVGAAVYAYAFVLLFFTPFLYKNGMHNLIEQVMNYKTTMIILFMILTLRTASSFLIQPVTIGLLLGTIYILYGMGKSYLKKDK
jgi:hypothetical protein